MSPAVLVTRPRPGAAALARRLVEAGFEVEVAPVSRIAPPEDPHPLRRAVDDLRAGRYDWVVFTSANGVRAIAEELDETPVLLDVRVGVVGDGTARVARQHGWVVSLVPDTYTAVGLVAAFAARGEPPGRVLFPAAAAARDTLPTGLEALGADVRTVVAYETVPVPREAFWSDARRLAEGRIDLLTLTSPSSAELLLDVAGHSVLEVPAAVIGPVTRAAAESLGFRVVAEAEPHTTDGLVAAVRRVGSARGHAD